MPYFGKILNIYNNIKTYFIDINSQYKNIKESFSYYWNCYGGLRSLLASPYLIFSIIFSLVASPIWTNEIDKQSWFDLPISMLPNLLGFTLGGYAILLAFGDDGFRRLLSRTDEEEKEKISPFMKVNGAFVHFVVVQVLAILLAILGNSLSIKSGPFAFVGFTCFIYAILTGLSAVMAVLRMAKWLDAWNSRQGE